MMHSSSQGSRNPLRRRVLAADAPPLTSLTYRSRAVSSMSDDDLHELQRKSSERNHAEGVTGLLLYDEGRLFQWLEGPQEGVSKIWGSISRDPRHCDIEVLGMHSTRLRLFSEWDLQLFDRRASASPAWPTSFDLQPSRESALALLALGASVTSSRRATRTRLRLVKNPPEAGPLTDVLLRAIETVVVPHLAVEHVVVRPRLPMVSPRTGELAHLLMESDPTAAAALIRELHETVGSFPELCANLLEPTARELGDLWYSDECSEIDLTMALCRMQGSVRELNLHVGTVDWGLPTVLVASQPGEQHGQEAALDAEVLYQAGWDMHHEFPDTDRALQALVAGTWFDALDLSLSGALRREDSLPRMATTIASARRASQNPSLVVVVGGRTFFERADAGGRIGADASSVTAKTVGSLITRALGRMKAGGSENKASNRRGMQLVR